MPRSYRLPVFAIAALTVAMTLTLPASAVTRAPGSAAYRIHLTSDRQGHTWIGTESVTFTNTSNAPMQTVWFHLWSNGVKGCGAHAITVSHILGGSAGGSVLGCTSFPVRLSRPLAANHAATVSMHVRIQLFHRNDRFGFDGGIAFLGTALPTLAVRDDHGWNLNPFVDIGESFYSLASDYRVTLETPSWLRTATTGSLVSTTAHGRLTARTYLATNVRDFEWAAGRFHVLVGRVGGTKVRVSYVPNLVTPADARQARDDAVASMRTFSADFGAYPYPEVDVVLTSFHGFGGMEYPTIIFTDPRSRTIAHELVHQWFYALVGNDQFREPWLDESFATWAMVLPFGGSRACASYDWPNAKVRLDSSMDYFRHVPEAYGTVYFGGSCMLSQLSDRFGASAFLRVLRRYVDAHRFGVARTADFRHAVANAARDQLPGFDLAAFWQTWRVDGR